MKTALSVGVAAVCATVVAGAAAAQGDPDARADALLKRLPASDVAALLHGHHPPSMKPRPPGVKLAAGWFPGAPAHGLPSLAETDASLGVANAGRTPYGDETAMPSGLAQAAGWDGEAAYAGGAMIGEEARRAGYDIMLAGGVNLARDPRNGRNFEYAGEDPLLAATIAGQSIRGIQSRHVASTVKHYALNDQETGRMVLDAVIDPAALRESDLLAFEKAIEIGHPASVMCAYMKINGDYACENAPLLTGVLKQDWKYPGWVMSDWGAVHSTVKAALSGLDQESGQELDKAVFFGAPLQAAVASGAVPRARYDDMAHRIVRSLYAAGVMDDAVGAPRAFDSAADAAVAERAAQNGLVLLKNDRDLLPAAMAARRILVIGGHADFGVISGGGSSQVIPRGAMVVHGPVGSPSWGAGIVYLPSSPLAAIRARAPQARVAFDDGSDPARAAALAKGADLVVVFATQWASEAFDTRMALDGNADALIAAVAGANPDTAVVLETGGAVAMPWLPQVGAVMEAWYPGARGGEAIAAALFGEVDPAGRLPVTFPASTAQLPNPQLAGYAGFVAHPEVHDGDVAAFTVRYPEGADVGYRWFERKGERPLFAFGHGLSYTHFSYGDLKVTGGETLGVSLRVTNAGKRSGVATPQVYAAGAGQAKRLIGWGRVRLAPGESRTINVTADPRFLARFDTSAHRWALAGGRYSVSAGASSADTALSGAATLTAQTLAP